MSTLTAALRAWPSDDFARALKADLEALPAGTLPLHLATTQGGLVDDSDISVSVLTHTDDAAAIRARVGVFFTEAVGGCNCHDDPIRANGYCLLEVSIHKRTAAADFVLLPD
jgi:hypothetical protein